MISLRQSLLKKHQLVNGTTYNSFELLNLIENYMPRFNGNTFFMEKKINEHVYSEEMHSVCRRSPLRNVDRGNTAICISAKDRFVHMIIEHVTFRQCHFP